MTSQATGTPGPGPAAPLRPEDARFADARPLPPPVNIPPGPGSSNGAPGAGAAVRPAEQSHRRTRTPRRPPRLASLQLKRVDPWTVLKISLIVSIVMFFVWMIAVGILFLTLNSMEVWGRINDTFATLTSAESTTAGKQDLVTPARVFGIAGVIGAINIVLFTALATVAAFVYNAAAGMSGGVEITLGERD